MVSSVEDLDSVVRCIKVGATDYLLKPFNVDVLRARLNASLAEKRLHDLQHEYLEQVGCVVDAAAAVETDTFEPENLERRGRAQTTRSASSPACSSAWPARWSTASGA